MKKESVTIDASAMDERRFEGWGSSLCWWANRLGYSDALAEEAASLFYGSDGLRLTIMRYNIGGGDNSSHHHITRTDSAIPGWKLYDEVSGRCQYDYDADHNQLNVLRRSVAAAGADAYVEVFSNSPPYFMTKSGCSSGAVRANEDNLRDDCYRSFAEYLAHVSAYMQETLGIPVSSVSPMNEPNTDYWWAMNWKQEGCHVSPGRNQSRLLTETADAFRRAGLSSVAIVGSDETSPEKQILAWQSYTDDAKAVLDRVSTHSYDTSGIRELGALARQDGFPLWMSEVDGGGTLGEDAGEMGAALWFADKIISDINALSPTAWVMWQLIDSHICADGHNGHPDMGMPDTQKGYWGVAVADHDRGEILLTQKYYAFGQFSRYIRPGAQLISCGDRALAAYDRASGELAIVAFNPSGKDAVCEFRLDGFCAKPCPVLAVRTSGNMAGGEHWSVPDDGIFAREDGFTANLKACSITTFRLRDVTTK
jgi:O-glycosyl hydrolase